MTPVVVVDTGIGVAAEQLASLFDRFTHGSVTRVREYGGLGLGLSIVKHLVQAHGGTVTASSEGIGQGARFTVRIPVIDVPVREPEVLTAPAQIRPQLDGLTVLLVEDDAAAREALEYVLAQAGARVEAVGSARDALARLEGSSFDALVSDIAMPGMDGYDLLRAVRSHERAQGSRRILAIALTGFASLENRDQAIAAGFDDHIPKPVDTARLVEKLALARRR